MCLLYDGFFSFAVVRQLIFYFFLMRKDNQSNQKQNNKAKYNANTSANGGRYRHLIVSGFIREEHPYQANGVTDDARQSAFGLLNTCLTEMCCTTDTQSYRGALVTADKVLAEISCASNGCEEDGLEPYVEDVLDTFLQAITTRKVKNLPQYMKSLLWTSFATYKLNTISGITAPYKEVKNVYGLH